MSHIEQWVAVGIIAAILYVAATAAEARLNRIIELLEAIRPRK